MATVIILLPLLLLMELIESTGVKIWWTEMTN